MNAALDFRESRLELLRFYASPAEQREWQSRAPSLGLDDPMEWWLEDFHPESDLFTSAFSPEEIELLRAFNAIFERASEQFPKPPYPSIDIALEHPEWLEVVAEAERLSATLK